MVGKMDDMPNGYEALGRAVYEAWTDEGIAPEYHRQAMRKLSLQWPTLYRAIVSNLPVGLAPQHEHTDDWCCERHGHHVNPHRGCILR